MPKYSNLEEYINTFNEQGLNYYNKIKEIISDIDLDIKERLFAGQVAFYVEETLKSTFHSSPVIVLAFFKDHVNIFASANKKHSKNLNNYKFTKKGTMQIHYNKELNKEVLETLFIDSLK